MPPATFEKLAAAWRSGGWATGQGDIWKDFIEDLQQFFGRLEFRHPTSPAPEPEPEVTEMVSPLGALAYASLMGLLAFLFLGFVLRKVRKKSSGKVAARAMVALLEQRSELPPVGHMWHEDMSWRRSPQLCCVCLKEMPQPPASIQSCEVCGVAVHRRCLRRAPKDCKHISYPKGHTEMKHHWMATGIIMDQDDDTSGSRGVEGIPHDQGCLYCEAPCGGTLLSIQPVWRCVWCHAVVHVDCHLRMHGGGGEEPPRMTRGSKTRSRSTVDLAGPPDKPLRRTNSERGLAAGPAPAAGCETCSMGPWGRLVLPPTCVRVREPLAGGRRRGSVAGDADDDEGESEAAAALSPGRVLSKGVSAVHKAVGSIRRRGGKGKGKSTAGQRGGLAPLLGAREEEDAYDPGRYEIALPPAGQRPLLVFLNSKSGPQLGKILRRRFLRLLNPLQVVDLQERGPEPALLLFGGCPKLRILVCGGDGTVGWVLSALDALALEAPPPVSVLPLGTGNDLARCLNWGGGLSAALPEGGLGALLRDVMEANVQLLDRWNVCLTPRGAEPSTPPRALSPVRGFRSLAPPPVSVPPPPPVEVKVMNNYFGVGVDAKVSLDFHQMRAAYPDWFMSQMGNKLWYTGMGAKDTLDHSCSQLPTKITVCCDGVPLELPEDIEGVLVLNIPSYMGGVDVWGPATTDPGAGGLGGGAAGPPPGLAGAGGGEGWAPQSMRDELLEVVGVCGSWHLGKVQVGLSKARRLTQCHEIRIDMEVEMPVQIDGEPWIHPAGSIEISHRGQAFMLRRSRGEPHGQIAAIVAEVLEQCEGTGTITAAQRRVLVTELAKRIHE